jgi:hypothetical protein
MSSPTLRWPRLARDVVALCPAGSGPPEVVHDNHRASGSEFKGVGSTQTSPAARHDDDLAVKTKTRRLRERR